MKIESLTVGQLQTNCYLVIEEENWRCFIVDPGDEANFISEKVLYNNLSPQFIIATHGHFDHVLAAYELQLAFEIPFLVHPQDKKLLGKAVDSACRWLDWKVVTLPPQVDKEIKEGDVLEIGEQKWEILATPGHTPGGITVFNKREKIAFVGDTIFRRGVGRTDFQYSSSQQLQKSIKKIRTELKGYTAYPGHGDSFVIE